MKVLLALGGGFASGVFLRSLLFSGWTPLILFTVLATLCALVALAKKSRAFLMVGVFCIAVVFGGVRVALSEAPPPRTFVAQLGKRVSYDGIVVGDPDLRDAYERIPVRVQRGKDTTTLLVIARRGTQSAVGDHVFVVGTLHLPKSFEGDNGRTFRYDKYLEVRGIRFMLDYAYVRITGPAPWYDVPASFARLKHAFLTGLNRTLPEPYASLAGGIVIGGKSGLGTELQKAFVQSGLVQIIVLSGYNVMVVAEWVLFALTALALPRKWSALGGALALLIFVGIAGASATAIRAAIMALIALYARATGRSYAASRALLFTVLAMLLWNPLYLAFDPGFALSVAATAGLIWIAPIIETYLSWIPSTFWKNATATTLAAQIAVLPLLLYFTGNLSLVAIPVNILVTPIIPLAMGFSALAGVLGALLGHMLPLATILIALPSYVLTALIIFVAEKSAALPWAALLLPSFSFAAVIAAYALLALLASSKRFSTTLQLRFSKNASR